MTSWPLLVSTLLTCCGLGTLFFAGLGEVRGFGRRSRTPALAAALVVLVASLVVTVVGYGSPAAALAILRGVTRLSGVSLSMLMTLLGVVLAVVYLAMQGRGASRGARVAIAALALFVGASGAWLAGNQYVLANKPAWNTWLLPVCYLLNALAMGGALTCSIMVLAHDAKTTRQPLCVTAAVVVANLIALVGYAAHTGWTVSPVPFWGVAVAVGCVVALACVVAALKVPQLVIAAFLCTAAGGLCLRVAMRLLDGDFIQIVHAVSSGVHGYGL